GSRARTTSPPPQGQGPPLPFLGGVAHTVHVNPEIRYARSGRINVAYQVLGDGPVDLLFVNSYASSPTLDAWQDEPMIRRGVERFISFSGRILTDLRGGGRSDRTVEPSIEGAADDFLAVLDAAGSERAAVLGSTYTGLPAMVFAATYPERATHLILWAGYA